MFSTSSAFNYCSAFTEAVMQSVVGNEVLEKINIMYGRKTYGLNVIGFDLSLFLRGLNDRTMTNLVKSFLKKYENGIL